MERTGKYYSLSRSFLDYLEFYNIVRLCATGWSNTTIANRLNKDIDYIELILEKFNFSGWKNDLDLNPYEVYKKSSDEKEFGERIKSISKLVTEYEITMSWWMCTILHEMDIAKNNWKG